MAKRKKITRTIQATVLAATALTGTATMANADSSQASSTASPSGAHCVVDVATRSSQCYGTFRQAISAATGGRITDAPENPAAAVASRSFEDRINTIGREAKTGAAPQARVTISIEYDWTYYQTNAGSITFTGPIGCDTDAASDVEFSYVGDAWNDRISSFKGYNLCQVRHYQHANFGDPYTEYVTENTSMLEHGGLNNQASSIRWA